jgi:hypothetical protein
MPLLALLLLTQNNLKFLLNYTFLQEKVITLACSRQRKKAGSNPSGITKEAKASFFMPDYQ